MSYARDKRAKIKMKENSKRRKARNKRKAERKK